VRLHFKRRYSQVLHITRERRSYTIRDNIGEWRRGCSIAGPAMIPIGDDVQDTQKHPGNCVTCTEELIDAIEQALTKSWWRRLLARWL